MLLCSFQFSARSFLIFFFFQIRHYATKKTFVGIIGFNDDAFLASTEKTSIDSGMASNETSSQATPTVEIDDSKSWVFPTD